ncbi:dsDNA nuclease domain-containing protein [Streptomyces bacillaris]|uniref:dsDNA nuclease domain-containing protein n=1 Tax=Streptomyces TaxID=1883 RepID=UPI001C95DC6E|nr:dsDNA nuclease domain-containing protein [Streptomyces cavourensis]
MISPAQSSGDGEPEKNEGAALAALGATLSPDNSGIVTFGKYRYQAKVAALLWLSCLQAEGPVAVICEHIDDVTLVWRDRVEFRQVKTRIPGRASWTFSEVCKDGGGIDSLMRSHLAFRESSGGMNIKATFSLWLEGASSLKEQTASFFQNPKSVSGTDRAKVLSLASAVAEDQKCAFSNSEITEFLAKLTILSNRVNEQDIDNMLFAALAEALPNTRVINVAKAGAELVKRAEDAQAGTLVTRNAQEFMLAVGLLPATGVNPLERQTLTREELIALLPDDPALGQAQLNSLLMSGKPISSLRRKMILACASREVQMEAASLQAVADSRRLEILASSTSAEEKLAELADEILDHGKTVAQRRANSTIPGQEVFLDLKHDRLILRQLDVEGLFTSRHGQLGYLCCLSDECEYSWRAS